MPNLEWKRIPVGPLAMNCYICVCRDTNKGMIIDPGDNVSMLLSTIEELDFSLEKILITHGHFDHILNLKEFQQQTGLQAQAHPADKPLFENLNRIAQMYGLESAGVPDVDFCLSEGEQIALGTHSFEILHTPGHSPGSVSFLSDGLAIVGDVLFQGSIGRTDLPGGSFDELLGTIRTKLLPLPDETEVLCGHGETTMIGYERKYNPFLL